MKSQRTSFIFFAFGTTVFISLFLFLTVLNPLTVYDTDDWLYIGQFRKPIPLIGSWNPIKVFPETFMPIISYFGALFIKPLIHNYSYSLTLAHGFFGSLLLSLYFVEFALLCYRKKMASLKMSICYAVLFIMLHFITYIHDGSDNVFLLWSTDLTCFYNYTLSAVLNASLVMHSMANGNTQNLFRKSNLLVKILVLIWIYFAIFSNLFSSVILASYIGTELLIQLVSNLKNKAFNLKDYFLSNILNLIIILGWFISNLLETTGGRASEIGKSTLNNIPKTILMSLANLVTVNIFITILGLVIGILWIKKMNRFKEAAQKFILYIFLSISYLVLLCSSANPFYIIRSEVAITVFFYLFVALIASFNDLLHNNKKYARLLIILVGTIVLLFIHPGKIFYSYNYSNISYEQCEALINDYINQFNVAGQNNQAIDLLVPYYELEYNWPIADFAGDNIAIALYKHRIIHSSIKVNKIVPDKTKNIQFNISESDLEENMQKAYLPLF